METTHSGKLFVIKPSVPHAPSKSVICYLDIDDVLAKRSMGVWVPTTVMMPPTKTWSKTTVLKPMTEPFTVVDTRHDHLGHKHVRCLYADGTSAWVLADSGYSVVPKL